MAQITRLVGVYDADGGVRGELAYLLGKATGRHCALCDITHSPVRRRREWDAYVASLPVPFVALHRNERTPALADATAGREACVVAECVDGSVVFLLGNDDLDRARDVPGMARALDAAIASAGLAWPAPSTTP